MKTSAAMDEIREIRDRNSLMHLSQSETEREQELKRSMEWFSAILGDKALPGNADAPKDGLDSEGHKPFITNVDMLTEDELREIRDRS